jgi:hypothetical protein
MNVTKVMMEPINKIDPAQANTPEAIKDNAFLHNRLENCP